MFLLRNLTCIRIHWYSFKLHLRPAGTLLETNGLDIGELPHGKTAEEVMGDFLSPDAMYARGDKSPEAEMAAQRASCA